MLLLHICCGPCVLYPLEALKNKHILVKGFFYNPNIHPYQEFQLRLEALKKVSQVEGLEIVWDEKYGLNAFLEEVFFIREKPKRCERCYYLRLKKTAELATQLRASAFSTTLLYSPFQQHQLIKEIAEDLSYRYKIEFYYEDWREGYYLGKEKALQLGIYRQKYCGCIFSEEERFSPCFKSKKN
ncbi:MAG: epoxyqueuosine reductase QueH [Caldimicrobium sp.]